MSLNTDIMMFSIDDVLNALKRTEKDSGSAENLASELTGLSIDTLWSLMDNNEPRLYFVYDIIWDTEGCNPNSLGLPETCFVICQHEDEIADMLSDKWDYCVCAFCSVPSTKEVQDIHAMNILLKEGYDRQEAENIIRDTSILDKKVMADSDVLRLAHDRQ